MYKPEKVQNSLFSFCQFFAKNEYTANNEGNILDEYVVSRDRFTEQ